VYGTSLGDAFASRDLDRLIDLMDEGVVWRGDPRQADEHGVPVCTDRDGVRDHVAHLVDHGLVADAVVLGERGDSVLIEIHATIKESDHVVPAEVFQMYTFRAGRVVLIQDYFDRGQAVSALG